MNERVKFTDSMLDNRDILAGLLADLPPSLKSRAKDVGRSFERMISDLQKAHPKCGATNIGIALAATIVAMELTKEREVDVEKPLVQLLS